MNDELKDLAESLGKGKNAEIGPNGDVHISKEGDDKDKHHDKEEKDKPPKDKPPKDKPHPIVITPTRSFGGSGATATTQVEIWNERYPELYQNDLLDMEMHFPNFKSQHAPDGRLNGWVGDVTPIPTHNDNFTLSVGYPRGYPCRLPMARVVRPNIFFLYFPLGHPHFFPNGCICAMFPPDKAWVAGRDSIAAFVGQCCIWLVGHMYWKETRKWPLQEVSHEPRHLYHTLHKNGPCHCGSGKLYGQCCRKRDKSLYNCIR